MKRYKWSSKHDFSYFESHFRTLSDAQALTILSYKNPQQPNPRRPNYRVFEGIVFGKDNGGVAVQRERFAPSRSKSEAGWVLVGYDAIPSRWKETPEDYVLKHEEVSDRVESIMRGLGLEFTTSSAGGGVKQAPAGGSSNTGRPPAGAQPSQGTLTAGQGVDTAVTSGFDAYSALDAEFNPSTAESASNYFEGESEVLLNSDFTYSGYDGFT